MGEPLMTVNDREWPLLLELPANRVRRNYRGGAQLEALEALARGTVPFVEKSVEKGDSPPPQDSDRPEDWIASTVEARNPGLPPIPGEGLAHALGPDGRRVLVRDLFQRAPEHFLGREHVARLGTDLGFLVKLLDSAMRLHVQAHPTAAFARQHLHSRWGKLETYVVLGVRGVTERRGTVPFFEKSVENGDEVRSSPAAGLARRSLSHRGTVPFFEKSVERGDSPRGCIRLGFQRPPTPAEWRRIVFEQDIAAMDACFDPIPVEPGEVWVVPGGLPHAIGEGLLVIEAMEPTDLVVRCEFEREGIVVPPAARFMGRDPDFALSVFDYTPLSADEVRARYCVAPRRTREEVLFLEEQLIGPAQTECFTISRQVIGRPIYVEKPACVEVGIVVEGAGVVSAGKERIIVRPGAKFLVAAAAEGVTYEPADDGRLVVILCRPGEPRG
jgi:mannose-6-phosphate isomerase